MSTAKYERSGYSFAIFLVWCTLRLPTNVGRTNYDELLNFQIVLTLLRHQRLSRCFQRGRFVPEFQRYRRAVRHHRSFPLSLYGRDEIVRQQLGFDFTGRGRIAGITFHGTFFIVANVKFVANGGHAFYAFRHFHGGFSSRPLSTKPLR